MKAFTKMKSPGLKDLSSPKPMVHTYQILSFFLTVYAAWKPLLHQLPFTISTTEKYATSSSFNLH